MCACTEPQVNKSNEKIGFEEAQSFDHGVRKSIDDHPNAPPRKSIAPLLLNLDLKFKEIADDRNQIPAKGFREMWLHEAEQRNGKLSTEDRTCIGQCVQMFFESFAISPDTGYVNHDEFMTFMLGGLAEHGAFGNLRKKLKEAVQHDPTALHKVYKAFEAADKDKSGTLDLPELMEGLKKLDPHSDPTENAKLLLEDMDLDGDGKVDYYEFLSYSLGRRKHPVELIMYDISHGVSRYFSGILLGRQFEAIYHTGVLVYGFEYWFGGQLFQNEPPMSRIFGEPLKTSKSGLKLSQYPDAATKGLMTFHLGHTLNTRQETIEYLNNVLQKQYTRETYDVLTHNCNSFSDDLVFFLTGNRIPEMVRHLPEMAMNAPVAKLMRPLLNKYLGGFGDNKPNDGERRLSEADHDTIVQTKLEDVCQEMLNKSTELHNETSTIQIYPVKLYKSLDDKVPDGCPMDCTLAQIIRAYKDNTGEIMVDLRWFNTASTKFVEMTSVPKKNLKSSMAEPGEEGFKKTDDTVAMAGLLAFHHDDDRDTDDEGHFEHHQQNEKTHMKHAISQKLKNSASGSSVK